MRAIEGVQPLRLRQAEQRQCAVSLQLDYPLHQRAGPLAAEPAIEHEDTHETARIGLEVGGEQRLAVGILRHRQAAAIEQSLERNLLAPATRCRSSATSSGPGCGSVAIGAASEDAGG